MYQKYLSALRATRIGRETALKKIRVEALKNKHIPKPVAAPVQKKKVENKPPKKVRTVRPDRAAKRAKLVAARAAEGAPVKK